VSEARSATETEERGIDRGVARRQAFLKAARAVFLEFGFEAASVNEIVRRAGGSLATLYAQFGNKEGLFQAVTGEQQERFMRELLPNCAEDLPLEQGLQVMGEQLLNAMLTKDNLAFYRIVIGEGRKFPELMQRYLSGSAERTRNAVANYIAVRAKREGLDMPNAERTASYFFEVVRGRHVYRAMADANYTLTPQEVTEDVRQGVQFFLHGAFGR